MASNDSEAALAFMAGLIGGYTGGREKKQERKRRDQQDAEDRAWREFQKTQAQLDNQYRADEARLRHEDDAEDEAREEKWRGEDKAQRKFERSEDQDYQLLLKEVEAIERGTYRDEQKKWREEDRDYQRKQNELAQVNAELDDLERKWNANGGGFDNTGDAARKQELLQRRKQLLSDQSEQGGDLAPGAKPSSMPVTQYDAEIEEAAKAHGLDPQFMKAIMHAESGGNPNAVSPKGAKGLFQFMAPTAKYYRIDPTNPQESIWGASAMLSDLSKRMGGDQAKILAGYNWGEGNVQKKGMDAMPKETRDYIARVNSLMGTSPTDNTFVSKLAQDSGLAPPVEKLKTPKQMKEEEEAKKEEAKLGISLAQDQIDTIDASGNTSPEVKAERERLVAVKEGFQEQLVPALKRPAPAPTATAGVQGQEGDKSRTEQFYKTMMGSDQMAGIGGFMESLGISARGALKSQAARTATGADDPIMKFLNSLGVPNPSEYLRESLVGALPAPGYGDTGGQIAEFGGMAGADFLAGGGYGAGRSLLGRAAKTTKSYLQGVYPGMRGASSPWVPRPVPPPIPPANGVWNMGESAPQQALPYLPGVKPPFQGVREMPFGQSPGNPISWLDNYVPPPPPPARPPLALPAPPPQGSVIPLPGPAPLPYNIPTNPMDIELLKLYLNSQRLGY